MTTYVSNLDVPSIDFQSHQLNVSVEDLPRQTPRATRIIEQVHPPSKTSTGSAPLPRLSRDLGKNGEPPTNPDLAETFNWFETSTLLEPQTGSCFADFGGFEGQSSWTLDNNEVIQLFYGDSGIDFTMLDPSADKPAGAGTHILSTGAFFQPEQPQLQEAVQRSDGHPNFSHPIDVGARYPLLTSPSVELDDTEIALTEMFGYINQIPENVYEELQRFCTAQTHYDRRYFPSIDVVHSFVELYFKHVNPQFPSIHPSTLFESCHSWILLLAISAIGCQYSTISKARGSAISLLELLNSAIEAQIRNPSNKTTLALVQSVLLRDICLFFSGVKKQHLKLQYERNLVITLYREMCLNADLVIDSDFPSDSWEIQLARESRKRLAYCIFHLECFHSIFLDMQPLINITSLVREINCNDRLWNFRSPEEYHDLKAITGKMPPCSSRSSNGTSLSANAEKTSSFVSRTKLLQKYLNKRMILEHQTIPGGHQIQNDHGTLPSHREHQPIDFINSSHTDSALESLTLNNSSANAQHCSEDVLSLLLTIQQKFSTGLLHTSYGWQANPTRVRRAKQELQKWFHESVITARLYLVCSAAIIDKIGMRTQLACWEPQCLLAAALYIRAYVQLGRDRDSPTSAAVDSTKHPPPVPALLLCLDESNQIYRIFSWIREGWDARIFISGLGELQDAQSTVRLLKIVQKKLLAQRAWAGLCYGLAWAIGQHLAGEHPSYLPDECDDGMN